MRSRIMSLNIANKLNKKIKGKQLSILADCNEVVFSDKPEKFLAILNAGLSNGIKTELVIEEVSKYAHLVDMLMLPNKSYCFLTFSDSSQGESAYRGMNGSSKLGQNGSPLFMSYCKMIPSSSEDRSWCSSPVSGLFLIEDCITEELEKNLRDTLKWNEADVDDGKLKNRKVQHFGYEFLYGSNLVDPNCPLIGRDIPKECDAIWSVVASKLPQFASFRPNQLTVNCYEPGNGIPPHCDTHSCFEDPIISLSLSSNVVMEFRQPDTSKHVSLLLPRRSLLIMSGESRFGWTHGITARMSDIVAKPAGGQLTVERREQRISFTFRKLKTPANECSCVFPSLCNVPRLKQNSKESPDVMEMEVSNNLAAKLEIENVHKVYNEIGSHFSETRHSPWPNVESFIKGLPAGGILLDVGCGNGKYLGINDELLRFGCDRSDSLLNVCLERKFNVFQCDCLELPIRDGSVDACISIAVIHHLATRERRLQAIEQMVRVLVEGGTALIYVWAKDQQKENKKSTYLLQHQKKESEKTHHIETATVTFDEHEIQLPVHRNRTQFSHTNVLVPWKLKQKEVPQDEQKVFLRYYHVFEDCELEQLCSELSNVEILKSYYDQGNHCVIIKKL